MTQADTSTGFSDVFYDLVAVQYHALQAGQTYDKYIEDAESAGEQQVAEFLRQVQQQDAERARRCHELLGEVGGTGTSKGA